MAQFIDLYISPTGGAFNEGYAHWEAVTVGGQTSEGEDATNELSYLFLESKREFPMTYPDLAVRIHSRTPDRFLYEIALTVQDGSGFPKLINDEEVVPLNAIKGCPINEALDYAISGCTETRMPNRDTYTSGCVYIGLRVLRVSSIVAVDAVVSTTAVACGSLLAIRRPSGASQTTRSSSLP